MRSSVWESDEDKEKIFEQAIQFGVNDKKEIEETGIEELTYILIASIRNRMEKICSDSTLVYSWKRKQTNKVL